ncbi:exopolyphosphatase [Thiomicrorhabdus immobilis]|uniref:Exopolyphosphatase n=1 Tax=Thiomicrorhabdus immobilis TaxID=2791037 RepID=A0ABN6CYM5_9GAMM|nr:exopolyphosphatase [Thiomicrorhabdus immobilis]BCN94168.1 exopolyphosphatase [Thiomicrorhabdus immobilis]
MTEPTSSASIEPAISNADLFAAIDLGSNSFHMIIARETHGQMHVVDKHKEMVRLRAGLDKSGKLSNKAFKEGIACLERFGQLIKDIPAANVRAVGTNTLRNASNSREFLKQAKLALGHSIQIIAGQEEARLIYLGVAHGLPSSDEQRLVMDIGGGSTEYIIGHQFENSHLTSTEMGCVSITQSYFPKGKITQENFNNAVSKCRQILRPHRSTLRKKGWDIAIGASGTIKSIGVILEINSWTESGITLQGMIELSKELIKAGSADNLKLAGLKDERRPVLVGGLAILIATFIELNIEQMQVSSNALREGLVFDTLGRLNAEDVRETSVNAMQQWMKVDTEQADAVARTAKSLYKQSHNTWNLHSDGYDLKRLLKWACRLHEIGISISFKRSRHHSAYLVAQADMAGFNQQEKQILSSLVVNQRGKYSEESFEEIDDSVKPLMPYLTVLLRLAVRIHRGRDLEQVDPILRIINDKELHLEFDDKWLDEHPLTRLDLETEAKHLDKFGFTLFLE